MVTFFVNLLEWKRRGWRRQRPIAPCEPPSGKSAANRSRRPSVLKMTSTIETMQPSASQSIPYAEWSDEDLLLAYRSGSDRTAFEELVCRYERELFNYLRRYWRCRYGRRCVPGDFPPGPYEVSIFRARARCPWLYTVATNQAIDAATGATR